MNISLLFLAGGNGSRFGTEIPKQFLTLHGKPIALHSFELLSTLPQVVEIAVVCAKEFRDFFPKNSPIHFVSPGEERYLSVKNGLNSLSCEETLVLIHDAARPLLLMEDIITLLAAAEKWGAATLAEQATQTIKRASKNHFVLETVPRETVWEIHTPQCIKKSLLQEGFAKQEKEGYFVTDDVSLIEALGKPVKLIPSSLPNIKITRKEDYHVAETLMQL